MRALLARRRLLLWWALGATVLMAIPSVASASPTVASAPGSGDRGLAGPAPAPAALAGPSVLASSPHPTAVTTHPGSPRAQAPRFGAYREASGAGAVSAGPAATKSKGAGYDWSSAYILYGPPPPSPDLLLGEGAGLVVDNARDEMVWFGGLGSAGLSNVTFEYEWYYNSSDPYNSSENASFTNSTTSPSARTNASFGAYQAGQEALLFGGLTDLKTQRTANDSWLYYFGNDTWRNISAAGAPPPREEAAFAVDQKDGIALLYGGITPQYSGRGVTGTVIWSDTWEFRFSTDQWTEVNSSLSPSGRFGASMVWDPVAAQFLLYGGCSFSCDSDTWLFSPSNGTWRSVVATGAVPAGRAGASFAWDPGSKRAVLFGGFSAAAGGGTIIYGDTYEVNATGQWTAVNPEAAGTAPIYQPGPLFDASTAWANFPGCDAMWVVGGNPSLVGPPEFVYVIQPTNDTPVWQCWSFLSEPVGPPQPPPPCSRQSFLVIDVENLANHTPIPNALVHISGQCLPATAMTGPTGSVQFTTNTPDNITINVTATFFHGNVTWYNYTYTNTTANTSGTLTRYVLVYLTPFPTVDVQVLGINGGPRYIPVEGADVYLDNFSLIAVTGANGWGNSSPQTEYNQTIDVSASAYLWSTSWKDAYLPYTGALNVTLVILQAGLLHISVVDSKTGRPIPGAAGLVTHDDPGLPSPFNFTTNTFGNFTVRLPSGNYSATARALGFLENRTGNKTYLPWVVNATMVIRLDPELGTNESVRLLNAVTLAPIAGGDVIFGGDAPNITDAAGWYNGSDLLPPGPMLVLGRAAGYLPNSTTIPISYNTVLPPLTLRLKPTCEGGTCPGPNPAGGAAGSPFFPAGGSALVFLLGAPAFLAIIGAGYAIGVSARRNRGIARARAPGGAEGA
jgi:hypothetical protein